MDFNNLKNDNGMYLYHDNNFKTISHNYSFVVDGDYKTIAILKVLEEFMQKSNKKYTLQEINDKFKELYGFNLSAMPIVNGSKCLLSVNYELISPSIIKDNYLEEAYAFVNDIMKYPDFTNQEVLDNIKREIIADCSLSISNPENVADNLYLRNVILPIDKPPVSMEDINELYLNITLKDLQEVYNKTFKEENFYKGLVFGNFTDEEYQLFRKYVPYKSTIDTLDYTKDYRVPKEETIIENDNIKEAKVYVTYEIDKSNYDINLLIFNILSENTNLCHEIIRNKYGLAYYSYFIPYYFSNCLTFITEIDYKNMDKLNQGIDEILTMMQDEEQLQGFLEKAKEAIHAKDYTLSENKNKIKMLLIEKIQQLYDSNYQEFMNNVDNYTVSDIKNYVKKLKRTNTFIYKGRD